MDAAGQFDATLSFMALPNDASPSLGFGNACRADWPLDFSVSFLNHGSFGSLPAPVHAAAEAWRARIEANPVEWLVRRGPAEVRSAANTIASFLGSAPASTGFVVNATAAANAVLRDIPFEANDEILLLDQGYNAVKQAALHRSSQCGAVTREVAIPLPAAADAIVSQFESALTAQTRLVILDQITSPTALVLPLQRMVAACAQRKIPVFVDGAHAPGMLETPADLDGATWWTGNLHKWLCAPKGCAVLAVHEDAAAGQHPPVISHGYSETFSESFDWQGTRDVAPWLAAPAAISYWDRYGGLPAVRARNHDLVVEAHRMLIDRFSVESISPNDGSMLGSMATLRLPDAIKQHADASDPIAMNTLFAARFKVEVPVFELGQTWAIRISAQVYNEFDDYERLGDAVETLCSEATRR